MNPRIKRPHDVADSSSDQQQWFHRRLPDLVSRAASFVVIPPVVVERTFAWLTARRRLARDYERDPAISEALIRWAAINSIPQDRPRRAATRQQRRTFTTAS
ncbi:hypothetical protein E1262_28335 [Jiangella aurantiaca]|uniref:Transposase n=1 Tax=Jiangella aurantiaca TaxID=2530373 RepID=A0A4R5A104_9ACTN|nr:hypothetical protein E1262_28335 [Jiangella aurantiaca]